MGLVKTKVDENKNVHRLDKRNINRIPISKHAVFSSLWLLLGFSVAIHSRLI